MYTDILANMVITKVCSTLTMYTEEHKKATRHNRERWAMILKYEGETVYTSNGNKYISDANNVIVLPKGSTYEWLCTKAGHFTTLEFDCDKVYTDVFSVSVKEVKKLFKDIEYKLTLKRVGYEIECIRDCYSVILKLIQAREKKYLPSDKTQKLSPAVNYIAQNYNHEIRNAHLAELCGLSTVYFRKLFSAVYGTSPMNYVKEIRIKKAREMLESDYGSITDIALSLGYSTIYDFSRDFKKHTGVSPSKY